MVRNRCDRAGVTDARSVFLPRPLALFASSAMSIHLPPQASVEPESDTDNSSESSSSADDDDQDWNDWVSDSLAKQPCRSFFENKVLPSLEDAVAYDKEVHGFDLNQQCTRLCLYLIFTDFETALNWHRSTGHSTRHIWTDSSDQFYKEKCQKSHLLPMWIC